MPATAFSVHEGSRGPAAGRSRGGGVAVAGVSSTSWSLEHAVQPRRELALAREHAIEQRRRDQPAEAGHRAQCAVPGARGAPSRGVFVDRRAGSAATSAGIAPGP